MCHEPVSGVDLLPTLCAIARVPVPAGRSLDGTSFLPIFADMPIRRKTPLYWQFNAAQSKPKVAMRSGDWKILAQLSGPELRRGGDIGTEDMEIIKTAELQSFELYNLRLDVGETTDLAQKEPERLQSMSATLSKLYREVRDESPVWPTWKWPRYESKRIQWAQ